MIYDYNYFNAGGEIGGYDNYSETTYFNETAEMLAQKFLDISNINGFQLIGLKVLVVGCAYGFLVKYLNILGVNTFGMDFSSYAISQAPIEYSGKIINGDVRLEADWIRAKTLAGLTKPNDKFDLVVDEDMICCLTNSEAVTFKTLGLKYSNMLYHLIDTSPNLINWYNFHTINEWNTLLGTSPKEKWYSRFYWLEN